MSTAAACAAPGRGPMAWAGHAAHRASRSVALGGQLNAGQVGYPSADFELISRAELPGPNYPGLKDEHNACPAQGICP